MQVKYMWSSPQVRLEQLLRCVHLSDQNMNNAKTLGQWPFIGKAISLFLRCSDVVYQLAFRLLAFVAFVWYHGMMHDHGCRVLPHHLLHVPQHVTSLRHHSFNTSWTFVRDTRSLKLPSDIISLSRQEFLNCFSIFQNGRYMTIHTHVLILLIFIIIFRY